MMYKAVIVDDEAIIVDGLVHSVEWEVYDFTVAFNTTSPTEALRYIEATMVDLLITDVSMPEKNGLELIKQARRINPGLSVLVISAYNHFDYVKTALKYGAENYLLKPIDPDELTESLSQIAGHMQERSDFTRNNLFPALSFRSNVTERWVKNNISSDELMEKAGVLDTDLMARDFAAVLFTLRDGRTEKMADFYEIIRHGLIDRKHCCFFFENLSTLVCVVSSQQTVHGSTTDYLRDAVSKAKAAGIDVFACLGSTVSAFTDVHKSYELAHNYLFMAKTKLGYLVADEVNPASEPFGKFEKALESNSYSFCISSAQAMFRDAGGCAGTRAIAVAAGCIRHLGQDLSNVLAHFPGLVKVLERYPVNGGEDALQAWTGDFLEQYVKTHMNLQQAMYPCVTAVIEMIRDFIDKALSLKTLAAKLNVSPAYLGHTFKLQTGFYFNDYLAKARLEYAQQLILTTDMRMSDIAVKAGFASQTYFNRKFHRAYGVSPIAYRREKKTI
jgi:two-component system response regulator YesN